MNRSASEEIVHGTKEVIGLAQTAHCESWGPVSYYARTMLSTLQSLIRGRKLEEVPEVLAASAAAALADALPELEESTAWRTLGWITAGLGAVAIGLFVGRELRQRYKFNRRTPYDFYAHSGDELNDMEFGVGI